MGSGIIYAVIIVMWAAYFIPRWLRRHDELSASRSVEKFDNAMRILSRRDPTPDRRYVVMPPRPETPRRTLPARTPIPTQRMVSRRSSRIALRRRRILAGLLLSTVVVTVATPISPLPMWAPVLLLGVTLVDLVHLRVQVRRSREVTRTRQAVRRSMKSRLLRFEALDRLMSVRREMAADRAAEEARWAAAEEAEARVREEEERVAAEAEGRWEPVPVPLPTYVSKPVVPRPAPSIDLTRPGAWSEANLPGAHVVDSSAPPPAPRPSSMSALVDDADTADDELDAIIDRRAVND